MKPALPCNNPPRCWSIPLLIFTAALLLFLSACQPAGPAASEPINALSQETPPAQTPLLATATQHDTLSLSPTETSPPVPTQTTIVRTPGFWKELPILPEELSVRAREIYQQGLAMGNDPRVYTKIGDCNSMSPDFLAGFGGQYDLGEDFAYLQPAIDYFKKSYRLPNQATNPGTTTSRLLVSLWNNDECLPNEPMLECQYRVDNPSIAIIMLGTIDAKTHQRQPEVYEQNLRVIIEKTISLGILPVLATKADNIEGDNSINETIARLAIEYELPLWNFWKAAQPLVNHGLQTDGEHLNFWSAPPSTDFSLPIALDYGKEVKNITALQLLNFLMEELPAPQ
ncbi:MAG TPA: SGNH/GDSL hydrolase family protein [Anaerolineaceae bacterium]|jgi:hypothetical protein|nr:SGNH/GDSL hydrolase family protein [Chloroflexota bacterium]HNS07320.1 SGNH/GDSL hydrolase family protein [Anaerolineaceae bacterium]HNW13680.1 SGNH/GDSL hydrolase family protein [Anaerolineaceae bacterium]HOE01575.1 SGNH/GDSL hydrolase family protein [Anaerolineaceae bacterium]HPD61907.1 SGNH/GDSL hydrolase family protein [Anaerolineaceae bacterium]